MDTAIGRVSPSIATLDVQGKTLLLLRMSGGFLMVSPRIRFSMSEPDS